jgi:hypothetical protein
MPFELAFLPAEARAAPGTPCGPWPRVDMLTWEMSWPAPRGAVSRGAAFAAADDTIMLAASALTTAKRRNALIKSPQSSSQTVVQIVRNGKQKLRLGTATRPRGGSGR